MHSNPWHSSQTQSRCAACTAHLLHEDAVVPLSCHAGVRKAQDLAEAVYAEVALPAAALSADGPRLLHSRLAGSACSFLLCTAGWCV